MLNYSMFLGLQCNDIKWCMYLEKGLQEIIIFYGGNDLKRRNVFIWIISAEMKSFFQVRRSRWMNYWKVMFIPQSCYVIEITTIYHSYNRADRSYSNLSTIISTLLNWIVKYLTSITKRLFEKVWERIRNWISNLLRKWNTKHIFSKMHSL